MSRNEQRPSLVLLSGPSGVGKDTVLRQMKQIGLPFCYATTVTTRPQRSGERDGVDYYFLPEERFQKMKQQGELLEWAEVYGYWYGVPKLPIKQALAQGQDVMIKVDVQGAATIKHLLPEAVLIFLAPPSIEEMARRLRKRHTESRESLELRLEIARKEMESLPLFDYVIVNYEDKVDSVVSQIYSIVTAEKCRV